MLGLVPAACAGSAKRDAARLVGEMDRYRRADDASRPEQARRIEALACGDPSVCDAKRACVAAVRTTARAFELKDEVARRLADVEAKRLAPDAPEAQALPGKLDEARRLLVEGRTGMADCERQLTDLRVRLGV